MSVILESQPGDEFICIQQLHASPDGERPSWETCRRFEVGERLRYAGYRKDSLCDDRPSDWMVIFDAGDGKRYSATQTYFVTEECWEKLEKFFAHHLQRESQQAQQQPASVV